MGKFLLEGEETKRLLFRKIVPSDFERWLPFHQDPKSTQYWMGIPKDPYQACTEQFQRIFERYEKDLGGMNALIEKNTTLLIGICGLLVQNVDGTEELEIGYSVLPAFRKKGFATEAAIKCREYAFKNHFRASLISIIHVDNHPSKMVARNNGMQLDKKTIYKDNPVEIFRIEK